MVTARNAVIAPPLIPPEARPTCESATALHPPQPWRPAAPAAPFRLSKPCRPALSSARQPDSLDLPDLSRTMPIGRASGTQGVDGISDTVRPVGIRNTVHPQSRNRRRLQFTPRLAGAPTRSGHGYLSSSSRSALHRHSSSRQHTSLSAFHSGSGSRGATPAQARARPAACPRTSGSPGAS